MSGRWCTASLILFTFVFDFERPWRVHSRSYFPICNQNANENAAHRLHFLTRLVPSLPSAHSACPFRIEFVRLFFYQRLGGVFVNPIYNEIVSCISYSVDFGCSCIRCITIKSQSSMWCNNDYILFSTNFLLFLFCRR